MATAAMLAGKIVLKMFFLLLILEFKEKEAPQYKSDFLDKITSFNTFNVTTQ
jgi:hypothetical protein